MPGEVKRSKATKTHTSGREHETPKRKPQSSGQEHETPKRKPQSSGQKPKPTKRRTLSGYQADEFKRKTFQKPYWCDGCREQGYGLRYKREKDNVELHRECLYPSPTTSHKCIPGCTFKFLKKKAAEGERYCYACGMAVHGFVYRCEKGWYLHPSCRKLEEKIEISRGVEFQLCCNKEPKKKCLFCKKKELPNGVRGIPGWFYVCQTASSSCLFHAYCTKKWVIDKWKNIGPEDNKELALKNMELAELNDDSIGRDAKIRKGLIIGTEVLEIIVRILLGDPTALIFPSLTKLLLLS